MPLNVPGAPSIGGPGLNVPGGLVGGFAVGQVVTSGFYNGFTLSWADDFLTAPDLVGPTNPKGAYFPTRLFAQGGASGGTLPQRGGITGVAPLTDPNWTGYLDSNRGTPVGYNNIRASGSILTVQARAATAAESAFLFAPFSNLNIEAEVDTAGAIVHYPASGKSTIVDFYCQTSVAFASWLTGSLISAWALSCAPAASLNAADEIDIFETNGPSTSTNALVNHVWTTGVPTTPGSNALATGAGSIVDAAFHLVTCIMGTTSIQLYVDGTLVSTLAFSANTEALPIRTLLQMFTGGAGFTQSQWNTSGTGLTGGMALNVDYVRVWRTTGTNHYKPLVVIPDLNLAYGASGNMTLPAQASLWGGSPTKEVVETLAFEPNCPGLPNLGTTALATFSGLPTTNGISVTYNSGTRLLSVAHTSGNAGRLHGVVTAVDSAGGTGQPARFSVNIGPTVSPFTITSSNGIPGQFDAYYYADCGIITPKTFALSGQPAGVTVNSATGLITWDNSVTSSTSYTLTCTNSVGTPGSATVTHTVATTAANYLASAVSTDNANTSHTFAAMPIGPAYATRSVLVMALMRNNTGVLSCTIGGVSATSFGNINPGGSNSQITLFGAQIAAGTTADVVITSSSGAYSRACIAVYTAPLTVFAASNVASSSTIVSQALSASSNVPAGGVVIAMVGWAQAALSSAWAGAIFSVPPYQSQRQLGLNSADFGAFYAFACASVPAGNAALTVSDTYTAGYLTGASFGSLLVVSLK